MAHSSAQWTTVFPTILLGFRATWKEDLQATTVEMIYGAPIRLPGEFLCPSKQNTDPATFVGRQRVSTEPISSKDSTSWTKYDFRKQRFDHMQLYFSVDRLHEKRFATTI
ncbi:integrase catalytic domain-containing protein [Nephila pilipes]|uniref:Integrase catalytic domain-containing protein n=1 Tax=Nephila pilipes TaxID=299642 RepID=A0A8X6QKW8_NEPPI|nr:integrase catalytic domain-containing protein [Nephila pilipes]